MHNKVELPPKPKLNASENSTDARFLFRMINCTGTFPKTNLKPSW